MSEIEEIKEFTEEIREENKDILAIIESTKYKLWFNILTRAGKQLIDYFFTHQTEKVVPGPVEKKAIQDNKIKSESMKFQNITLVEKSEKGSKFRNDAFEVSWFSTKGVKYAEDTKELEVLGWWIDFVNKNGESIEFKKETK